MICVSKIHGQHLSLTYLADWRRTLRAFTKLFRGTSHDHIPIQVLGRRRIWAMMSVFLSTLALIPSSNVLNVARLGSASVIVE
jgi:hypothetical protein